MATRSRRGGARTKTVFLVIHQGFAARYVLRTDIFRTLKAAGTRIVILTPNADEPYMAQEFAGEDVQLESLESGTELAKRSRLWWLLFHLRLYGLAHPDKSPAFAYKYEGFRSHVRPRNRLVAGCLHLALQALWRSRRLRRLLLATETALYSRPVHRELFERYRPDLVVTTSPGYFMPDAVVLREARRRGVPGAALILSWDNPTTKGYRGADPDWVAAWSESMADQLVQYQDIPRERIVVEGVAHFDAYLRDELPSRAELCRRLDLDPDRRLIVYATSTPGSYGHNLLVAKTIARAIAADELGAPAQLVIRLHPIHFRDGTARIDGYRRLEEKFEHVRLDLPQVLSQRLRCDLPASDGVRLAALLRHGDVLVNVFSTTTLEAFLADTPVVTVSPTAHLSEADGAGPDGGGDDEAADPIRTADGGYRAWHEFTHLRELVHGGGVRIAESMPDLTANVRAYIERPELDRAERLAVARTECGPTDGRAGARIGDFLLGLMDVERGRPEGGAADGDPEPKEESWAASPAAR